MRLKTTREPISSLTLKALGRNYLPLSRIANLQTESKALPNGLILFGRIAGHQAELQALEQGLRPSRKVLGPLKNYRLSGKIVKL